MNPQRWVGAATVALLVAALLLLVFAMPDGAATADPPAAPPPAAPVAPAEPVRPTVDAGPMRRVAVPRREAPAAGPSAPAPAKLTTEQWRDYNIAVDDVIRRARDACLREWAQSEDKGKVEIIFDAVLWDGVAVDFGIRGLGDIPDHVLDCVADIAWSTPFPEHTLPGEIRLQRPIQIDGRRR